MALQKVTIEAVISSPTEKVWNYWTKPEHITKWNFASPDWQCPRAANDLKPGGKYFARMEAKDGSFGFDFEAIYEEVVTHKKIVYTMGDGRQASTLFQQTGDQTKVITTFDIEDQNSADMQRQGWQAILNNFKQYTESN